MSEPIISIIIPVYNGGSTISRCLDSVLYQSQTCFEVIVVNDGSVDNTLQILNGYQKRDVRVHVLTQKNEGVSVARNNAIRYAHGEWITFIDADDYIEEGYFDALLPISEDTQFSICGMTRVHMDGAMIRWELYKDANHQIAKKYECGVDRLLTEFNQYALTGPMCKLFRADIIRENGLLFYEDMSFGEDSVFVYSYLKYVNRICVSESWLYKYVDSGNCLTRIADTKQRLLATDRIYNISMEVCKINGIVDLDTIQYHYVDSILQNVVRDKSMKKELRYKCYNDIAKLVGTSTVNKCMPFYFAFFSKLSWWRLYEIANRVFYNQKFWQ